MDKYLFFHLFQRLPEKLWDTSRDEPQRLWWRIYQENSPARETIYFFIDQSWPYYPVALPFGRVPTDPAANIDLAEFM